MSGNSVLEEAWNRAQPGLESIRDFLRGSTGPTPRVIRVGQLDSEILDKDLASLLQEPLNKALSLINTAIRARFEPELSLLIQLTLYKLSVWNTGASYGAKLQDLRYVVPGSRNDRLTLTPSGLPRRIILIHGTLTLVIPYLHTRIRSYALSHAWPDAPSSDRRRKVWNLLTKLESLHNSLALVSFIAFMWDGRYRTIADRLLNISLIPARRLVKRDISYEFMNRQMVWHAFTEFLLFLLPLINARTLRRRINRLLSTLSPSNIPYLLPSPIRHALGTSTPSKGPGRKQPQQLGKYWSLPQDQCAICAENASFNLNISEPANAFTAFTTTQPSGSPPEVSPNSDAEPPSFPLNTTYIASCGDLYCYHCIAERLMRAADEEDEAGWECLRCCEVVKTADRFTIEMGSEQGTSDYDFSSDQEMGVTDLSGSVGSYSEFSDI
ncbi:hypothetical protein BDN72DRAFT_809381 [Pluteus cervinus]|uniref:Uncharacterized protein n=1 Tax=Pluteus cervinus TaxID=181527 RepID=A0ACD3BC85_9AGAR|nr:hypothetical protein BDN72DRAFT_809381 [Pluteus cervinus]